MRIKVRGVSAWRLKLVETFGGRPRHLEDAAVVPTQRYAPTLFREVLRDGGGLAVLLGVGEDLPHAIVFIGRGETQVHALRRILEARLALAVQGFCLLLAHLYVMLHSHA